MKCKYNRHDSIRLRSLFNVHNIFVLLLIVTFSYYNMIQIMF